MLNFGPPEELDKRRGLNIHYRPIYENFRDLPGYGSKKEFRKPGENTCDHAITKIRPNCIVRERAGMQAYVMLR